MIEGRPLDGGMIDNGKMIEVCIARVAAKNNMV